MILILFGPRRHVIKYAYCMKIISGNKQYFTDLHDVKYAGNDAVV